MSSLPVALEQAAPPVEVKLAMCPSCQCAIEAEGLTECMVCGGQFCGLLSNNCPTTCKCDPHFPLAAELIQAAQPMLSEFCVHKSQDCSRCFLKGKASVYIMKDEEGRFVNVNGADQKYIKPRSGSSLIGLTLFDLMPEHIAKPLVMQEMEILETGHPLECVQKIPDPTDQKKMKTWFVMKRLMKMNDGRKYIVGVAYDITSYAEACSNDKRPSDGVPCNQQPSRLRVVN